MSDCNPGERLQWTTLWITEEWELGVRAKDAFDAQPPKSDGEIVKLFRDIVAHPSAAAVSAVPRLAKWMGETLVATAGLNENDPRKQAALAFEKGLEQAAREVITAADMQ